MWRPRAKVLFLDFMYFGRDIAEGEVPNSSFASLVATIADLTRYDQWLDKPECQDTPIQKLWCIVQAGGTPVILGKPGPFDQARFTPLQAYLDKIALVAPLDVDVDAYPLFRRDLERPGKPFELSPAAAAYVAYCIQRDDRCHDRALKAILPDALSKTREARFARLGDMSVVWGSRQSDLQKRIDEISTGQIDSCRDRSLVRRLMDDALLLHGPRSGEEGSACLHTVSTGYDRLINMIAADRRVLDEFLSGAVVMVGTRMATGNDWIDNPVQGRVAGVYYHAMALDNLMARGLGQYRRTDKLFDSDALQACLTALLIFTGLMALMVRNEMKATHAARTPPERLRSRVYLTVYGLALLAWAIVLLGIFWLGAALQRTVAVNWIAVSSIALGGALIAARDALKEDVGGSLMAHPVGRLGVGVGARILAFLDFSRDRVALRRPAAPTPDEGSAS